MDSEQTHSNQPESEFAALAEGVPEGIIVETRSGPVYANQYASDMTGFTLSELISMSPNEVIAPNERARVADLTRRRMNREDVPFFYESEILTKDKKRVPVEITAARANWGGEPATIGFLRDISARRKAEKALRESEEMLAQGQSLAKLGNWRLDYASGKMTCSREFYRIHGLSPDTSAVAAAELIATCVHPDDQDRVREITTAVQDTPSPVPAEYRIVVDGNIRVLYAVSHAVLDERGRIVGSVGTVQDITERRMLERELLNIGRAEQQRIGRDLHDSLGQELAGIAFLAAALQSDLQALQSPLAKDTARLVQLTREALRRTRQIAHGLVPVDIVAGGLASGLDRLCGKCADIYGIKCRCNVTPPGLVYDNETATHLYHIASEAVNNAVRHGNATVIDVSLDTSRQAAMTVRDNGRWQPQEADEVQGMGLRIIHYRSELIRGHLTTDHSDSGTTLTVTFKNSPPES